MAETYISISQFSNYIKNIFDAEIMLHHIFLYGEVSSYNVSNHIAYFTLKDQDALLNCVMFNASAYPKPNIGDMVLVQGSPNYYIKGGRFSFQVSHIEPYGKGKLYEDFLQLKEKLEKLGYFDPKHKKAIPQNIKRIGVVTSKEGAVIQDIINITTRRNPMIDIVLYPVKVQGIGAEQEIAEGIHYFSNFGGVDCVVVARGGGSAEDLQAYNTETVAHAVYNCTLPIISAVGHETDVTICDFCSDLRVPTPSAAAEVLAWDWYSTHDTIIAMQDEMIESLTQRITNLETSLMNAMKQMTTKMNYEIEKSKNALVLSWQKLVNNIEKKIDTKEHGLTVVKTHLDNLNPTKMMQKGYVKLEKDGKIVKSIKETSKGDVVSTVFIDGKLNMRVE